MGRSETTASKLDGGVGRRRGNGRRRRFRAPRLDSAGEEVGGVAAELSAIFDLLGKAPDDGDAAAGVARSRPWRLGLGFRETENVRGERGSRHRWGSHPPWRHGSDELVRRGRWRRARSLQRWSYRKKMLTLQKTPWPPFLVFFNF